MLQKMLNTRKKSTNTTTHLTIWRPATASATQELKIPTQTTPTQPTMASPHISNSKSSMHIIATLLLLASLLPCLVACPADVCICKWKGGKQTVECGGQQLPAIPEGMDPGTQVLNFSGNSLQVLQSERFLRMDLLNLQKIYLSRNQLIHIHEKAFRGLTNLVELDLSENALQHVPSETFQDYTSLMRLSLSGNSIRELKTSAFRHLSFLTTLELSNCQIERVENEAFVGMDNLEWLRLDGNRISFIQGAHILPKSLHGISLQTNRWTCDCRLLDLHSWLVNYNTPQLEEPRCMEPPRLKGQFIKALKRDDFACLPEVEPKSTYTEISEGRNISIMCVVRAIPAPTVLWLFNGQVMTNDSLQDNLQHMYYYIDESSMGTAEEKRSEIFIYNVGAEDNGTFSCVGQNIAGTTFSNYTLRVIIKEPPVVNEVSFPRDYMNYIIASSSGAAVIFIVLLCTIVIKCRQSNKPSKRKKAAAGHGANGAGSNSSSDGSNSNETALMKCSSIINDDCGNGGSGGGGLDALNGMSGMLLHGMDGGGGGGMTPSKLAKENGIIIGGQMKQNLMMYAPAHFQQHLMDGSGAQQALQLNASMVGGGGGGSNGGTPPPPQLMVGGLTSYCSPPASLRNFQEKNPDLVNDAESVKHKFKSAGGGESDYDGGSDCSAPCSLQGMPLNQPNYENCYQLAAATQFGAQMLRAAQHQAGNNVNPAATRFAAMTTLPRGMQLKTVMQNISPLAASIGGGSSGGGQHQVDVHLNPVCFLGQDGFAYDYSNYEQQQPPAHHHLHLQQHQHQHHQQQQQQQQQHSLSAASTPTPTQQQNFYRTLPHNRAHKQQQFAAAANSGLRYSLEAEFLQRSGTPTYEKYLPNVRFTAEGYPVHAMLGGGGVAGGGLVQYPSPPEGYKSCSATSPPLHTEMAQPSFQQWPPCLPGYHAQPIRYPPTLLSMPNGGSNIQPASTQSQSQTQASQMLTPVTSCHTQTLSSSGGSSSSNSSSCSNVAAASTATTSAAALSSDLKKRCVAAQADDSTIPECDESDVTPTTSTTATATKKLKTAAAATTSTCNNDAAAAAVVAVIDEETTKLRHLTGPLADSPDEGYVGDSQEGSDI